MQTLSVDLWFDTNAEDAVNFYVATFPNSKIKSVARYGPDMPGPEGTVMYIEFEIIGQRMGAVNGGPIFTFSPAISLVVTCDSQDEVDDLWNRLSAVPEAEQCGWLQDKYGVSWQIVPKRLGELMTTGDAPTAQRVTQAMMSMKKLDIAGLERAAAAV